MRVSKYVVVYYVNQIGGSGYNLHMTQAYDTLKEAVTVQEQVLASMIHIGPNNVASGFDAHPIVLKTV